jgi:glycosyltransferase involved in cell wall biosynthesis
MARHLRVSLITFGFGEYTIRTACALAAYADVQLVIPIDELVPHSSLLSPRVQVFEFAKPRLRQPFRQLRMVASIQRAIHDFNPDVVHMQQGHLWFSFSLPFLRRPLVMTIHDPRHHLGDRASQRTPQSIIDYGFRRADQVIVMAEQLRPVVRELGLDDERIHVVPHLALGERSSTEAVPEEEFLVLFFGRIWPYKGLDYLIHAEPLVSATVPQVHFLIAGQGEDFSRYRSMMVHPERFTVHNRFVPQEECARYFQRASFVVLPYVDASQSGVIAMAYTYGKPVVATTVGGLPEMVDHGQTGLLVPPRDVDALSQAIVHFLQNPDERRRMGENALRRCERDLSADAVAEATLTVYQTAVAGRNAGRRLVCQS